MNTTPETPTVGFTLEDESPEQQNLPPAIINEDAENAVEEADKNDGNEIAPTEEAKKRYRNAVRRVLGKPKKGKVPDPWALSTLSGKAEIAKLLTQKTVAGIQLVDNMTVKQRIDAAIALGEEMLNAEGVEKLNPELRLKGIAIIAAAGKVSGELSEQILRIAEKATAKGKSPDAGRGKNLPPSTGLELTVGEGDKQVTVRAAATTGNTE